MAHSLDIKNKAISLRELGKSLSYISKKINVPKSTVSGWVSGTQLSSEVLKNISDNRVIAQQKVNLVKKKRKDFLQTKLENRVKQQLFNMPVSAELLKTICAILFWTEGSKSGSFVSFINSDPKMISLFLYTLRHSFNIDESKLRGLVHVHEYHNEGKIKEYWSQVSGISLNQFNKSYKKTNTGKRKKEGYLGSFRVRYYDVTVARELTAIYTMLPEVLKIGL